MTCLHRLCAHDNSVTCLQFDDRFVVSGGNDGRVKLWDARTGVFIRELTRPCDAVWRVNFREDKVVILCQRGGKTVMEIITFRPEDVGHGRKSRRSSK
jgi:F-box and WD-40 domain protein CDC4